MLAAGAVADGVFEWTVGRRHRRIILLDAAAHLRDERALQRSQGIEQGRRIGVLGLEMSADVGRQHGRIAQGLPPILRLEPGVGVFEDDAVDLTPGGPTLRMGRPGRDRRGSAWDRD